MSCVVASRLVEYVSSLCDSFEVNKTHLYVKVDLFPKIGFIQFPSLDLY